MIDLRWLFLLLLIPTPAFAQPRLPWTTSKLTTTPERPHSFTAERAYPKLSFADPVQLVQPPGGGRWFVVERRGKIFSFVDRLDVASADLVCDLPAEVKSWDPQGPVKRVRETYALAFHPRFPKNRSVYVCYILDSKKGEQLADGTRISRFRLTETDPPRLDVASEQVLLTFQAGGHNGCDLQFGPDGLLYISTGDAAAPNPPDGRDTGQRIDDLLASILRIDVDRTDPGLPYAIPRDNPFVGRASARPEVYAFGLRNPWRMRFDPPTGDLWVGDVGWELWELVHRVKKGGNYGWSIKEGPQDVNPSGKLGPAPISPPELALPHTEAASITGGFVYRGRKLPELTNTYIFGDYVTRRIWSARFDQNRVLEHREIAQTNARIIDFAKDADGELLFLDFANPGGIHRLVPNDTAKSWTDTFPRKLSETGLFKSTKEHALERGVRGYQVNLGQWLDGAGVDRFVAFPGLEKAKLYDRYVRTRDDWGNHVFPPKHAVFGRTIRIPGDAPAGDRRVETQLLHFDGSQWRGYSYAWNDAQTDAELVDAKGMERPISVPAPSEPSGKRTQTWRFPSRTECFVCHNPWAGFTLSFTAEQLDNCRGREGDASCSDLRQMEGSWFDLLTKQGRDDVPQTPDVVERENRFPINGRDIGDFARAYLHVNCAHCHQFGAGGSANFDVRMSLPLSQAKLVDVKPALGTFDIADPRLVAPGDPTRSILYYRMAKLGRGHMPHIGSAVVDRRGLDIVGRWIQGLPANLPAAEALDRLDRLAAERQVGGDDDPKTTKIRDAEVAKLIDQLTETPEKSLLAIRFLDRWSPMSPTYKQLLDRGLASPNVNIRDLFEPYAPPERRAARLGDVSAEQLLSLAGDPVRGREVFFSQTFQCGACHQVEGKGGQVGPDLSDVAKRLSKTQIIESILTPSRTIDPKFATHAVETEAGQVHTGLLIDRTADAITLRIVGDKTVRIAAGDIASTAVLPTSLMPENLLRDATPAQAGDLLAFLWTLTRNR